MAELKILIADGYGTVEDENGNQGFGVYIPSEKQIYVAGDVPPEILYKALFHELAHWIQDLNSKEFSEDDANEFAEKTYDEIIHLIR